MPSPILVTRARGWSNVCRSPTGAARHPVLSAPSSRTHVVVAHGHSQTLEIEFNSGSVYDYAGVPQGEYDGFMGADSKGKYFHANIKNRYSFVKL